MNLILDIGNTRAKLALIENETIVLSQSYQDLTLAEIEIIVSTYSPQKAIVCIVGKVNNAILDYIQNNLKTITLDHNTPLPIQNNYTTPNTLGYDRIAVAVGANYLYPNKDILIIDAGTAITYELVTSNGIYQGGAISPGIQLRFKSLNNHTAHLPYLEKVENFRLIGKTTNECIYSGVLNGTLCEIDGYIDEVRNDFPKICVILTGGDSNFFANKLKNSIFVNQDLMVIGLNRILELNALEKI
ncbi:MAG: type III pantothenate kinase [Bacteroidales bacterium]